MVKSTNSYMICNNKKYGKIIRYIKSKTGNKIYNGFNNFVVESDKSFILNNITKDSISYVDKDIYIQKAISILRNLCI